jgi:hypothetical protein
MNYGFTTLRDLGSVDPEWPTIDLRNALAHRKGLASCLELATVLGVGLPVAAPPPSSACESASNRDPARFWSRCLILRSESSRGGVPSGAGWDPAPSEINKRSQF